MRELLDGHKRTRTIRHHIHGTGLTKRFNVQLQKHIVSQRLLQNAVSISLTLGSNTSGLSLNLDVAASLL